ncbi:MAG: septal ring lytic transglycosylase RlpA family protein [Candidatus Aureabacteria bacterium]|jgi:rare lipoprotein A|nr:septal ring lytic transglycosylase RlpA family protein [Candidatus Auribacterota bacterium]NLW93745.1 septal ring lytic transglycosylase RlpA family protein [Chlamydiota bacterium]HOE27990.1 septal ring lytic transglycosylase RlpA family protein [bacterium]HQM51858.1 septal ring lytic transglycosylase RlpA family protein [bacterium]
MRYLAAAIILFAALHHTAADATQTLANGGHSSVGIASWYSRSDRGIRKTTANMERFSDKKHTCAAWHLPFNTMLRVTNLQNGKSVIVRVNDRGPAKRLVRKGRIIDLTKAAFLQIADPGDGLIPIQICRL